MSEWFQRNTHALVELGGFIITGLAFALKLSHERHSDAIRLHERLTAIETKLDLLMDGRELLRVKR